MTGRFCKLVISKVTDGQGVYMGLPTSGSPNDLLCAIGFGRLP